LSTESLIRKLKSISCMLILMIWKNTKSPIILPRQKSKLHTKQTRPFGTEWKRP
jgi:hypothetical protein